MAKLIFVLDGNVIKEYAIDKERMTIGRRASNDIHIDNLAISGEHAVIVTLGEDFYIEDLNSTNGTLVNKKQIKKYQLKHGDEIGLGKYELKFLKGIAINASQPEGFADTILATPESSDQKEDVELEETVAPIIQEPQIDQVDAPKESKVLPDEKPISEVKVEQSDNAAVQSPRLQILNGDDAGNALMLDKSMVKIGQSGEQVAVVTKRQDGYYVTHILGDQYPSVNGSAIGTQARILNNHDEIEVLGIKMEFLT